MTIPAPPTRTCANPRCARTFAAKLRKDGTPMASLHGYCPACMGRWQRANRPDSGPPDAQVPGESGRAQRTAQARADRDRAAAMEAAGTARTVICAVLRRSPETLRKWLGPPQQQQKEGNPAMPRNITTAGMPRPSRSIGTLPTVNDGDVPLLHDWKRDSEPAPPQVREYNWHPVDGDERAIIEEAQRQAREREASIVSMGRR